MFLPVWLPSRIWINSTQAIKAFNSHQIMDIPNMYDRLAKVYAERNQKLRPAFTDYLEPFHRAASKLLVAVRDGKRDTYEPRIAKLVAWHAAAVNGYTDLPFGYGLVLQFPEGNCLICRDPVCPCDPVVLMNHPEVREQTKRRYGYCVSDWQHRCFLRLQKTLAQEGAEGAIDTLFKLRQQIDYLHGFWDPRNREGKTSELLRVELAMKMAELLGLIMSVSTLLGVQVHRAVLSVYDGSCPDCEHPVCGCPVAPPLTEEDLPDQPPISGALSSSSVFGS